MSYLLQQRELSRNDIRGKLLLLDRRLRGDFAHKGLCMLPAALMNEVRFHLSDRVLETLGLHLAAHLRLHRAPPIHYRPRREITEGQKWNAGLFRSSADGGEIWLFPSPDYGTAHILSVLAHEFTHAFLHQHGIREEDEFQNEVLTDTATVYLGFGHWLRQGYQPVERLREVRQTTGGTMMSGVRERLGYISPENVDWALIGAARLRGLAAYRALLPWTQGLSMDVQWRWQAWREQQQRGSGLRKAEKQIAAAEHLRAELAGMLERARAQVKGRQVSPEDAAVFGEVQAELRSQGEKKRLELLRQDLNGLESAGSRRNARLSDIERRAAESCALLERWVKVLKKYR